MAATKNKRPTITVNLRMEGYHDNGNGTISIHLPAREVSLEESKILADLFPHTQSMLDDLFATEALIASKATVADLSAPPAGGLPGPKY